MSRDRMIVSPPASDEARQAIADVCERRAVALVSDVRDLDPTVVWQRVASWSPQELVVMVIALAAMVPEDRTAAELRQWYAGLECTAPTPQPEGHPAVDVAAVERHLMGDRSVQLSVREKQAAADLATGWRWSIAQFATATGTSLDAAEKALLRSRRRQDAFALAAAS